MNTDGRKCSKRQHGIFGPSAFGLRISDFRLPLFAFLLLPLAAHSATNLTSASLQLDDKAAIELTAGLKQYEDPPRVPGKLTSVGSALTTVELHRWAAEFSALHPEAELNIVSSGSVEGFAKLLAGQTDIVPISRSLSAEELASFKAKFGYEPTRVVVAQNAVGVYVNKDNPVAGLTLAQLEAIYSRAPKSGASPPEFWSDLGVTGPLANERLNRVSLSKMHGTHLFLRDKLLHGGEYRFDVHFEPVSGSLVQAAGADPAAIGCASVMFGTERTRFVPLQAEDGSWLLPTYENTTSGRYPLTRPLRVLFNRKPNGTMNPLVREFLRFAVSRRGQRIIALADSYPLTLEQQQEALRIIGEAPKGDHKTTDH
jgi:phosphate transport system substrate-binding protein